MLYWDKHPSLLHKIVNETQRKFFTASTLGFVSGKGEEILWLKSDPFNDQRFRFQNKNFFNTRVHYFHQRKY